MTKPYYRAEIMDKEWAVVVYPSKDVVMVSDEDTCREFAEFQNQP